MTILEMHIGIELGLQYLNSAKYNVLQPEERDYFLNKITEEFIRVAALGDKNIPGGMVAYDEIKSYYEIVQTYLNDENYNFVDYPSEGYVESLLSKQVVSADVSADGLRIGVTYKVITAGTTDLTGFGGTNPPIAGEEFVCEVADYTYSGGFPNIPLFEGSVYMIINTDGFDFTAFGAIKNKPGELFICNQDATPAAGGNVGVQLKFIVQEPTWAGTTLRPLNNNGFYAPISSEILTECDNPIISGVLELDEYYVVLTNGATDLSDVGGKAATENDIGFIFKCISIDAIVWDTITTLKKIKKFNNRLVKFQDVPNYKSNAYGYSVESPISVIMKDRLRVYHFGTFPIWGINLQYVNTPVRVNKANSIDSDLPLVAHQALVDMTVQRIAGITAYAGYQGIVAENQMSKQQ